MLVVFFVGRGMSKDSKRAKERQNRSSDELVMAETKFERSQFFTSSGRPEMDGCPVAGRPVGSEIRKFGSG